MRVIYQNSKDMKRTKSIFAIGLALMGIMALGSCKLSNDRNIKNIDKKFYNRDGLVTLGSQGNADKYTMGGASLDAKKVKELEIDWLGDEVSICAYDGNELVFSETSDETLADNTTVHYRLDDDGTLEIVFGKPGVKMEGKEVPDKRLTVKVPRTLLLEKVELNGIGYTVQMDSVRCEDLEVNHVSNNIVLNECEIETVEVNGVSTIVEATFSKLPEEMELNNVSGSTMLYVPENAGISIESSGLISDFESDLPCSRKGSKRIIGDGSCKIESNTVTGSLEIHVKD